MSSPVVVSQDPNLPLSNSLSTSSLNSTSRPTIRLLLADDQALVRGALATLLSLEPDLDVVAEASRGDVVLDLVLRHQPDVALLDIEMPGLDGLQVAAQLRDQAPQVRCLIVTTFGRPGYLQQALKVGAMGFVVKDTPARELAEAVRRVHAGLRVVDPHLAVDSMSLGSNPLTAREIDVLLAARDGSTVDDMSAELFLSRGTVRNYLSSAMTKTNARTRAEAVHLAEVNGWLPVTGN